MSDHFVVGGTAAIPDAEYLKPVADEPGEQTTRRFFLAAAGAAGLLYTAVPPPSLRSRSRMRRSFLSAPC